MERGGGCVIDLTRARIWYDEPASLVEVQARLVKSEVKPARGCEKSPINNGRVRKIRLRHLLPDDVPDLDISKKG